MVDNCKHVLKISPASDHSILNPQKWACETCGTTESVWACLSCSNVACGRYISEHAIKHYQETKHPLSLEVNDKFVYCYECGDYVLNDNAAGDLKILRSALSAVTTQSLNGVHPRSRRMLRSQSFSGFDHRAVQQSRKEDRNFTALWFRRYYLLAKAFSAWKQAAGVYKKPEPPKLEDLHLPQAGTSNGLTLLPLTPSSSASSSPQKKKRAIVPGVTGLRNLGNTCYMNSVLQVLRYLLSYSHLQDFRDFFLQLKEEPKAIGGNSSYPGNGQSQSKAFEAMGINSNKMLMRQTTMECFQHVSDSGKSAGGKGGLNGGSSISPARALQMLAKTKDKMDNASLCQELHALLRVMWSGKWALVSPHKMLYAVWNIIPFFRGYSQQDAQEFLCEFLDKVSTELEKMPAHPNSNISSVVSSSSPGTSKRHTPETFQDIVSSLFQGQLISEVTCLKCDHKSKTYEPFMDLSLEFPKQTRTKDGKRVTTEACHLEEMLTKFTDEEKLDGAIYACDQCNGKKRRASAGPTKRSEAQKRFLVHKLPHVLRLHLKRFMWSGRNNRGKITAHVQFEEQLDLKPFCHEDLVADTYLYQLSAVVMHHGRGFGSGHYTAYCWNEEADSWIHCNDAKMQILNLDEVMKAQGYIMFYTRRKVEIPDDHLAVPLDRNMFVQRIDEDITFNFTNSTIPRYVELKRKLSQDGARGQRELKRRKSNMW